MRKFLIRTGLVLMAVTALFVLLNGDRPRSQETGSELARPALDNIDAGSRAAMRELLRKNEENE